MVPVHATVGGTWVIGIEVDDSYGKRTVILILRLSAMFGGSKPLRNWLLVLLGGQIIAEITIVQTTVVRQHGE